jgi:hypothetical protein
MRTAEEIDASVDGRGPDPEDFAEEGGGFTFETVGGLVKGRCGKPSVESAYAITKAATRLKHELASMQKAKHDPDAGPLFSAVDGGVIKSER